MIRQVSGSITFRANPGRLVRCSHQGGSYSSATVT
jgi:hypothetical protein